MNKKQSELTFKNLTENLSYIKVYWNDKLVYNDEEGESTLEELENFKKFYDNKIVYEMNVKIVQWHHCILKIKSEKDDLDIIKEWNFDPYKEINILDKDGLSKEYKEKIENFKADIEKDLD